MEKINIAELLKDCPKGMELDCTMFDNVKFIGVDDKLICVIIGDTYHYLTKFGTWTSDENAKCVIFPKGKTTWEGFHRPYINGDIVYTIMGSIAILGNRIGEHSEGFHSYCGLFNYEFDTDVIVSPERLATEEEKEKLFKAIKEHGYKWNEETKTLDKLVEPKFKVRDRIKQIGSPRCYIIQSIEFDRYILHNGQFLKFGDEHIYELVPKFDINILVPFESRVLVRSTNDDIWRPAIYGFIDSDRYYIVGGIYWKQCIPYEGNQELLGTTNKPKEYGSK